MLWLKFDAFIHDVRMHFHKEAKVSYRDNIGKAKMSYRDKFGLFIKVRHISSSTVCL